MSRPGGYLPALASALAALLAALHVALLAHVLLLVLGLGLGLVEDPMIPPRCLADDQPYASNVIFP
jgi:hypothetical protein